MLPCSSSAHMEEERDAHMQTEVKQYKKRKEKETAQMFIFFCLSSSLLCMKTMSGERCVPARCPLRRMGSSQPAWWSRPAPPGGYCRHERVGPLPKRWRIFSLSILLTSYLGYKRHVLHWGSCWVSKLGFESVFI